MPDWSPYVRRHLRLTGLRREREAEIVEDLARQLEDAYRDALAAGAAEPEARLRAEQHVGDWDALARHLSASSRQRQSPVERWTERTDDRQVEARGGFTLVAQIRQDLLYGARALRQHAGFTAVAVLSLALGIGANTAIFSVMNALLFRPLPVRDPQQLVVVSDPGSSGIMNGLENGARTIFSYKEFTGLRDGNQALDGVFAFTSGALTSPVTIDETPAPEPASVLLVTGNYFSTLGVEPAIGRVFGPDIDQARLGAPYVVVSHAFWRNRLRGDPLAVGRTVRLRQTVFTIVGVLPQTFTGIVVGDAPDVFVPVTMQEAIAPGLDWLTQPPGRVSRVMFLHVVGRLRPGVSLAQANTSLNLTFHQNLEAEAAQIADADRRRELLDGHVLVRSAAHGLSWLRGEYQQPLTVLMALVGLLLLLACGNVANLLLSWAAGRERELALRVTLGAGRSRLVRQLLTESLLLATLGAGVGLFVAILGIQVLLRLVSESSTPIPLDARLDATVLAFTAAVALVTGVLFGLAPALRATRLDLNAVLRGTARSIMGSGRRPGRWPLARILVGAQVALSLLLLITAGLFVRSLQNLSAVSLGYDSDHLAMFRLTPLSSGYPRASVEPLFEELLSKINALPGVRSVSFSGNGLFYGGDSSDEVSFPGYAPPPGQDMGVRFDLVGPHYFATLGVPILTGRDVEAQDATGLPPCWLNQSMTRYFFKDDSPIGRRMVVHYSFGDGECEIRGVVADSRTHTLRDQVARRFYMPFFGAITKPPEAVFEVRTLSDAASVTAAIRQVIHQTPAQLDPPVFHTVPELIDRGLIRDRLTARLSTLFGAMALLLASIGLYGVLSFNVARRVGEIGVRMAFGAERRSILGLVLREAWIVTLVGVAVGVAAALAAARLLGALLYGLTARDPATIGAATVVLIAVATLAAAVPAWRASRTDPLVALRSD
jgi:predicted permease